MSGQVLLGLEPEDGYCLYITELDYTAVYGSSGWVNMGRGGGNFFYQPPSLNWSRNKNSFRTRFSLK